MVWDRGDYRNLAERHSLVDWLKGGLVEMCLGSGKIHDGCTLTGTECGDRQQWHPIKMHHDGTDAHRPPVSTETHSATFGLTLGPTRHKEPSG